MTDWKDQILPYLKKLPAVKRPVYHVHFRSKLMWTIGILLLYLLMANIPLFGLSPESIDIFARYRAFFAGRSGSLLLLGIGPIVMASIVLQLLVGADILKLDLTEPKDQAVFQGLQKLLVFVMIVLETIPQIAGGMVVPSVEVAKSLGVSTDVITTILFIQIFIGGAIIMFMDEVVEKWGIGSGVSLFILAGVSQAIITGAFNWQFSEGLPIGVVPKWFWMATHMSASQLLSGSGLVFLLLRGGILAAISTILIFVIVVYVESTRVELPLSHAGVRGARGRYPIKLIYASVLPMILVRALQGTIQMFGTLLYRAGVTGIGTFEITGGAFSRHYVATSGLMYYLSPVRGGPSAWIPSLVHANPLFSQIASWQIALRLGIDIAFMVIGGAIFALFWVETANMGPKDVAHQISSTGMLIPGFRRNPKVIKSLMDRYIPRITMLGGMIIGALCVLANMMGTLGNTTGTGILLAVSIAYQLYQNLASEQMMEMHPMIRKFIGE